MRVAALLLVVTACGSHNSLPPGVDGAVTGSDSGSGSDGAVGDAPAVGQLPTGDPFDGTALDPSWSTFNAARADIAVANGALAIAPRSNALWFAAGSGPLVFKLVTGDVKLTSTVHARKTSNPALPPSQPIEVGGLMLRNPSGSSENYVFVDIGFAEQQRLGVEHKSTRDSTSTFDETPSGADADLRLCRTGSTITAWRRDPNTTTWKLELTVARPDLPATLQAGLDASTGQPTPDVTITFDAITFEPVGAGCDR